MEIDQVHREYLEYQDCWRTYRDVLGGDEVVKRAGERYLARLDEQTDEDFGEYVKRGFFFNATARTVAGYVGMIFRKAPVVVFKGVTAGSSFLEDVDLQGSSLASYCKKVVEETIAMGRCGTLVDFEGASENRPYLAFYQAENILNWRQERVNGRYVLTFLTLREFVEEASPDGFESELVTQVRVLRLIEDGSGGRVLQVQVWKLGVHHEDRKSTKGEENWELVSEVVPRRKGKGLPEIPFVFHGPVEGKPAVERSPIADIVAANLDHYRLNADYKHGMHYTALPTAWVSGFEKAAELRIGSRVAWVSEQVGATAAFLEFKGEGLTTFERAMDRTERLLTVLGSRLIESQKRVSESAEALSIRAAGEHSIVGSLASSVSVSLTQAIKWVYWWLTTVGTVEDVSDEAAAVHLNTDFETARLAGPELQALVATWQAGGISRETFIHNLTRGEIIPAGADTDREGNLPRSHDEHEGLEKGEGSRN